MPTDTRRLTGPESSQSPYNFAPSNKLDLSNLEKRPDGRSATQLRPLCLFQPDIFARPHQEVFVHCRLYSLVLRTDIVSQARGSSYIEMNETKVICAVYGPREVLKREDFSLKGQLTCDFKFTTFSCRQRRQHQQDSHEKDLSVQVLEALEPAVCLHKYPKSQINIFITVLQHDGCALSAAIMCASLALASAGIEMYDLVVASSAAICGSVTLFDPTSQEEEAILKSTVKPEANAGSVTVAFLPSLSQLSAISSDGELSFQSVNKTMQECVANCQRLYPVLEHTLIKHQQELESSKT